MRQLSISVLYQSVLMDFFQDFVDVTLACSDGSTLDAHKVILSSVSTYFRDILKTAPCKHPIIILKDTCKDEASAMLEFAYTGEVNLISIPTKITSCSSMMRVLT